jgi:hypothetical protein
MGGTSCQSSRRARKSVENSFISIGETFFHPGSRIRTVSIPDPGSSSKKQKNGFQALKNKIRVVHPRSRVPDPDADFFPSSIPDPGVKKLPILGSRIRIRNTAYYTTMRKPSIADPDPLDPHVFGHPDPL